MIFLWEESKKKITEKETLLICFRSRTKRRNIMALGSNQKVAIYYNQVDISGKIYKVFPDCPKVEVPWRQATEYAEMKVSTKEWTQYLIPELTGAKVIFEGESINGGEIVRKIVCTCGNEEEMDIDTRRDESKEFIHSLNDGEGEAYYICVQCHNEVKSITE